jgi:hypothetical protein
MLKQNTDYPLNDAEPWVVSRSLLDLHELDGNGPEVLKARQGY